MDWAYYIAVGVLEACGIAFSITGIVTLRNFNLIRRIPLSAISAVNRGIVKIRGKASAEKYLKSPFSKKDCVYYRYEIETYRAVKSGKRTSYQWKYSGYGDDRILFTCTDSTGSILINPKKAEFHPKLKKQFYQKGGPIRKFISALRTFKISFQAGSKDTLDTSGWGLEPIDPKKKKRWRVTTVGDKRFDEFYIEPQEQVFIVGTARQTPEGKTEISRPGKLIISNKTPENLLKEMRWNFIIALIIGPLMLAGGIALLLKFLGFY